MPLLTLECDALNTDADDESDGEMNTLPRAVLPVLLLELSFPWLALAWLMLATRVPRVRCITSRAPALPSHEPAVDEKSV